MASKKAAGQKASSKTKKPKPTQQRTGRIKKQKPRESQFHKARLAKRTISKPKKESFAPPPGAVPPKIPKISMAARKEFMHAREIDLPAQSVEETIVRKKAVPHAVTALTCAAAITVALAALFVWLFGLGLPHAAGVSVAVFVGFSILFYNYFESRDGAGQDKG